MQPGETVTPGASPVQSPPPEQPQVPQQAPVDPTPPQAPPEVEVPVPPTPEPGWNYSESEQSIEADQIAADIQPVSWTASEYVAHAKGGAWFVILGLGLFALALIIYLLSKDLVPTIAIVVAGLSFGVFAGRQPRVLQYIVDSTGVHIGPKLYHYGEFKSFDVTEEGSLPAIQLIPLKRFMPPITLFYDQNQEDAIMNVIASYIPHQEQKTDIVDSITRRIRF